MCPIHHVSQHPGDSDYTRLGAVISDSKQGIYRSWSADTSSINGPLHPTMWWHLPRTHTCKLTCIVLNIVRNWILLFILYWTSRHHILHGAGGGPLLEIIKVNNSGNCPHLFVWRSAVRNTHRGGGGGDFGRENFSTTLPQQWSHLDRTAPWVKYNIATALLCNIFYYPLNRDK